MTFTCTISSIAHLWNVPSIAISQALLPHDQGQVISDPPFQFAVTEVRTGTSITSTATVNITADLNGTLVLCQDGIGILPDQNSTITLRGMGIMYLYLDKLLTIGLWVSSYCACHIFTMSRFLKAESDHCFHTHV